MNKKTHAEPKKSALLKTINEDGAIQKTASDLSEALLDQLFSDGLLKDIPIIGTIVHLYKSTRSIRQQMAVRKLALFVQGINNFTEQEKQKLEHLFEGNEKTQRSFAANILLAIDRQDDIEKPIFLIRFFRALVNEEIELLTFSRLRQALDKFNLELLPSLRIFYGEELIISPSGIERSEEILHELSLSGLVTVSLESSGTIGGAAMYKRNLIGELFIRIGLKDEVGPGIHPSNLEAYL